MSFNLFGPTTKDDIKVGYIDPSLGYVDGVTICEANEYAKNNPGTTFIFRDGDNNIRYLNINEVNSLTPKDLIAKDRECGGVQNYTDCGPPRIHIYGGGGIGAVGNPIIGRDGSLLAVDLVSGGHGYQYPPLVTLIDDCKIGNGAVLTAILGQTADRTEVYEGEEDFEEYQICEDTGVGNGLRYGLDGEELGDWDPTDYTRIGRDPIEREIEAFQRAIEKPFWTTRKYQPNRIIVSGEEYATQETSSVTNPKWGEFMNLYAVSPVKPSDSIGTDEAGKVFSMEWEHNFPISGEYIFRGVADDVSKVYIDNVLVGDLKSFSDNPSPLQKTIKEGNHTIRIDVSNIPATEKVSKTITSTDTNTTPSNVTAKFIQKGTKYYLQVDGSGSAEISFVMDVNDATYIAGLAAKEVVIPSDSGKIKFTRKQYEYPIRFGAASLSSPTEETIKKSGKFSGGKLYGPIEIIGADPLARGPIPIKTSSNEFALRDADGDDKNIKITIDKIKGDSTTTTSTTSTIEVSEIISSKSWKENPIGVSMIIDAPAPPIPKEKLPPAQGECPPNPIWTTRFPGATKQWYPVRYSGLKKLVQETTPSTSLPTASSETQEVEFTIFGSGNPEIKYMSFVFTSVDGQDRFELRNVQKSGKTRVEKVEIKKNVNYVVVAQEYSIKFKKVEQGLIEQGTKKTEGGIGESNKIFTDFIGSANDNNDMQVTASLGKFVSSNKRKIGRNTYDLIYVFESAPAGQQNVTPNPEKVYETPGWSSFMNRYAISPVLPLNTPGSDTSGVVFSNSWKINLPYSGFYGVKGTGDNSGRILIDGKEITKLDPFNTNNPKLTKVSLSKGNHTITTEIFNDPVKIESSIDTKVFSTQDWRVAGITSTSTASSNVTAKFIQKGTKYYLQVDGSGTGEISFVMDINDASYIAGLAAKEVVIPSDSGKIKFARTQYQYPIRFGAASLSSPTEETIKKSGTFSGGKLYGPIEIIGADPLARGPIPITNGSNEFALRDADGDDKNIKITIDKIKATSTGSTTTTITPVSQSPTKNGVTYDGPELFGYIDSRWSKYMNDFSVSPKVSENIGKYVLTWKNVKFPYGGTYKFNLQADNTATLKIGGREIFKTSDFTGEKVQYNFNTTPGTYDIVIELENFRIDKGGVNDSDFQKNPMGVALYISKDVTFTESNKTPWKENPMGVSAILIPPPCAKKIGGKGVVARIIPTETGNGYLPPPPESPTYNVQLILEDIITINTGINYNCGVDEIKLVPDNGSKISYTCDAFGRITNAKVEIPGDPITIPPIITIEPPPGPPSPATPPTAPTTPGAPIPASPKEPTGVNAKFIPVFRVIRDPIVPPEQVDQLIQVTDLVGLKQTGYVDGRAYYGAVYYDNGVPYAGYYKTAGTQTRVYATLQESITAQVTTPPSAIQRSGTDITSNDPRLNIPGTIQDTE